MSNKGVPPRGLTQAKGTRTDKAKHEQITYKNTRNGKSKP